VEEQFARFAQNDAERRIYPPGLDEILALPNEVFQLWSPDDIAEPIPEPSHWNTLLSCPLVEPGLDKHLSVVQIDQAELRLDETWRVPPASEYSKEYSLNLNTLLLDPLYASSDPASRAFNLSFKTSQTSDGRSLMFPSLESMLHFQHATTGFEAVTDQPEITVQFQIGRGQPVVGKGRLQLWIPRTAQSKFVDAQGKLQLIERLGEVGDSEFGNPPRRSSAHTSNFAHSGGSSSTLSQRSSETATIVLQEDRWTRASFHTKPKVPMLVLFVGQSDSAQWFSDRPRNDEGGICVAIEMAQDIYTDMTTSKRWRTDPDNCRTTMIRRPNGQKLVAYRTIGGPSTANNLSVLGAYQMKDALAAGKIKALNNLEWVFITFRTASGKTV